jgi:hypothetical protein
LKRNFHYLSDSSALIPRHLTLSQQRTIRRRSFDGSLASSKTFGEKHAWLQEGTWSTCWITMCIHPL